MKNLAMAVVIKQGGVLIQERYRHKQGRVYEFPGGTVDAGESGIEAAVRELREETGLNNLEVLGEHKYKNDFGGDIYFVVLSSQSDLQPQATDPVREQIFYWFGIAEIPRDKLYVADVEFIDNCLNKYI